MQYSLNPKIKYIFLSSFVVLSLSALFLNFSKLEIATLSNSSDQKNSKLNETKFRSFASKMSSFNNDATAVPLGKATIGFKNDAHFQWLDQENGVARVQVDLSNYSFSNESWKYEWILTEGATSSEVLSGVIEAGAYKNKISLSLTVQNLNPQQNQNTVLRLKPMSRQDSANAIVIPSQLEQTEERVQTKAFLKKQEKTLFSQPFGAPSSAHLKGLHF